MAEWTIIGKSVDAPRTLIKLSLSIMLTCVKSRHDKDMIHAMIILNHFHLEHTLNYFHHRHPLWVTD